MKWFVYTRGTIHLHRLAVALLGIHEFATKLNNIKFEKILYIVRDNKKLWWAWDNKEIRNLGAKILKKCSTDRGQKKHFAKHSRYAKKAIEVAAKIKKTNLTKLSNKRLIELYDILYQPAALANALMDPDIDAVDIIFEEFLQNKIKRKLRPDFGEIEFLELYKKLSTPSCQSYIAKQEKNVIKLALRKKIDPRKIKELYNKYWWTNLGWENMVPYNEKYFLQMVKKYSKDKNLKNKLNKLEQDPNRTKKQRKKLIKKYHLSKEINYWLKVADKYNYFHDLRKEMQVKSAYSFYLLMSEVARRLKLNKDDLEWLWHNEVKDLLQGKKLNKQEIKRRQKAICVRASKREIKTWSGKAAIIQHKKELDEDIKSVKEFKGVGVTSGKVKAKIKVCSGAKEALKKIRKGDILVCGMTLPDYVPAMKRAAAIITDEGGITCHAAIISRELGIPCIVGTKIATRVLKDGDLVEVNANHGVVRILK